MNSHRSIDVLLLFEDIPERSPSPTARPPLLNSPPSCLLGLRLFLQLESLTFFLAYRSRPNPFSNFFPSICCVTEAFPFTAPSQCPPDPSTPSARTSRAGEVSEIFSPRQHHVPKFKDSPNKAAPSPACVPSPLKSNSLPRMTNKSPRSYSLVQSSLPPKDLFLRRLPTALFEKSKAVPKEFLSRSS